jgi:hypothetical protein
VTGVTVRRVLGPIALVVLIVAVGIAVYVSARDAVQQRDVVTVRGLIGSEKQEYLQDPALLDELRKNGIDLKVETSGSREMVSRPDLKSYDFAFPAGAPSGQRLQQILGAKAVYNPFFTPMTIASWKTIAAILTTNKIVSRQNGQLYIVDMPKLLNAEISSKRWTDFAGSSAYAVNKSVLVSTTDPRSSNSGIMYAALASYVLNGNQIVDDRAKIAKIQPEINGLFLRQGYEESSSAGPFDDYTEIGMGKAPLVMIYESQFIEYMLANPSAHNGDMVLLYPKPTIYTKHTFVPITARGDKLGQLLTSDEVLQHLAVAHGFRIEDTAYSRAFWKKNGIAVPDELIDVVDPPSYEFLETIITGVEHAFATN